MEAGPHLPSLARGVACCGIAGAADAILDQRGRGAPPVHATHHTNSKPRLPVPVCPSVSPSPPAPRCLHAQHTFPMLQTCSRFLPCLFVNRRPLLCFFALRHPSKFLHCVISYGGTERIERKYRGTDQGEQEGKQLISAAAVTNPHRTPKTFNKLMLECPSRPTFRSQSASVFPPCLHLPTSPICNCLSDPPPVLAGLCASFSVCSPLCSTHVQVVCLCDCPLVHSWSLRLFIFILGQIYFSPGFYFM